MTADAQTVEGPVVVPLEDVEAELARQLKKLQGADPNPVLRARMSNLLVYCNRPERAAEVAGLIPRILLLHPSRLFLLVAQPDSDERVTASVQVNGHRGSGGQVVASEEITLRVGERSAGHLPAAVRCLSIGDLPTNLWWTPNLSPALSEPLVHDLAERAEQVVYDSLGWTEPARGVSATATWLPKFERQQGHGGPWRVVSDLNWRRLKYWRRLVTQALDPATAPGALETITEIIVEHGPHAVVQAWELVSWLASRLGWQVRTGKVQQGVEISWRVVAGAGELTLRLRRKPDGPSEIQKIRIACMLDGEPAALDFGADGNHRLAVTPEGVPGTARTVTVQGQSLVELIGRQLSDREHDPVFRESLAIARILAQSVHG